MMRKTLFSICLTAACWLPQVLVAQSVDDSKLTEARLKGVEFLKSKQLSDGNWEFPGHDVGITSLCTLALVENGVSQFDPMIEKGHRYVKKNTKELGSTYDISLAIVLLSRLDEHSNKSVIRDLGARLIAGQNTAGGWTYTCPAKVTSSILTNPETRPKPPEGFGDNSCTQLAVLGLWTASRSGIDIDQPMAAVAQRFKATQNSDGGWPYTVAPAKQGETTVTNPSGSAMTFAGLFCLTAARANKLRKQIEEREIAGEDKSKPGTVGSKKPAAGGASGATKKLDDEKKALLATGDKTATDNTGAGKSDASNTLMTDPIFAKGLEQAGRFVQGGDTARYFLWSIERLGVMLGLEKFGGVDWFAKNSDVLLKTQKMDGSWPEEHNDKGLSQTAFAVLFLRKANLGSDISRLLEGEPEKAFVFVNRADKPRFGTIDEALKAALPGETLRIEGDGPFKLPHVIIDKNLTIEAGYGYLPTFVYDVGLDSRGLRARPEKDPETRYMLKVANANVTLEGLKLDFDAPEGTANISWCAVRVAGGSLRMLNCSITEEGRKGVALVEVTEPSQVQMRNCLLGGGRAAIEVAATGQQTIDADNSLLFSDHCVAIVKHTMAKDASTALTLRNCTLQGTNVIHTPNVATPVSVTVENSLLKTDWIGGSFLTAENSKNDRTWQGNDNVYGVSKWLGSSGRPVASIIDAKSFGKYWGIEDKGSIAKQIVFEGKRQNKSSSHRMRASEFALATQSELGLSGSKTGIQFLTVGAGRPFSRYRESIVYSDWKKSLVAK
ncbi:MAG: hypothetical protein NT013_05790 [Planctomycetia bacterium]|nr:hypothetical protein [Planctomycetia bacterium]